MKYIIRKILNKSKLYWIKIKFLFTSISFIDFPSSVKIQSPLKTIQDISNAIENKKRGAYLRFGDGDVNLLLGLDDLLQYSSNTFSHEMREAFELNGDHIYKCLPIHSEKFGKEHDMRPGYHSSSDEWASSILKKCFKYFIGEKIYSHVALSYLAASNEDVCIDFLKKIKSTNPIFVGNRDLKTDIVEKVLHPRDYIKTNPKFSYSEIDRIEKETLKAIETSTDSFILIVIAMGCAGRVLQKRLLAKSNKNIFIFDFGSLLDILNGDETRAWMNTSLSNRQIDYWKNLVNKIN